MRARVSAAFLAVADWCEQSAHGMVRLPGRWVVTSPAQQRRQVDAVWALFERGVSKRAAYPLDEPEQARHLSVIR